MSFNNEEDGDGLAALFGGITPQTAPQGDPGPRRAAPAPEAPQPEAAQPAAQLPAASHYPGLASSVPGASQVAYPPPESAGYPHPASAPSAYVPPAYVPPAYAPPTSPGYEMPAPAPQAPASYDLPPPAAAPPSSPYGAPEATQYPGLAQSAPAYPTPTYPSTAQYPAGLDPVTAFPTAPPAGAAYAAPAYSPPEYVAPAYSPPEYVAPAYSPPDSAPSAYVPPGYPPPAADVPVYAPPAGPVYEVPASAPPVEPSPYGATPPSYYPPPPSHESYDPYGSAAGIPALAEPPRIAESVERPAPEHPLVRSEPAVPATVFPPGPLLPSSTAAVETPEDLERSTMGEKVGLVLALLTGPIGLVLAIANAIRSERRRGWLIGVVRVSLVLGVLSTIAGGIAGYVYWTIRADQIQHAEIAAASAEFCAAAEADPTMVTPPTLGWPAQGDSVGESLTLMQAWTDRWTTLAATSPAELSTGLELLAGKGQTIIDAVTEARIVDDAANQTQIAAAEVESGVADWHATYCVEP